MKLQPHRRRYWLNAQPIDRCEFEQQVKLVCALHQQAAELAQAQVHLVSCDEMTGIQALERAYPTCAMQLKQVERAEFEYIRHGTVSLIANWEVAAGKILCPSLGATRNEADFALHLSRTIATDPQAGWIFIVDQLNTHKSESLVRLVIEQCALEVNLGIKGKSGILHSMVTRSSFLAEMTHRIRFVYLPKHTSWLNQIECWFSILARRLLKRGNFTSTTDLKHQILQFIAYFNQTMAKPFNWKFEGFNDG